MIQADVYKTLSEDTTIAEYVGKKIYAVRLPQDDAVPAVVYSTPDISPTSSLDGDSGADYGSVEIVCWSKDYTMAHEIAHAVRTAFASSGLRVIVDSLNDAEDMNTRNYGVVINMRLWSTSGVGSSPLNVLNPIAEFSNESFVGDGITVNFTLPKFRSGSLLVFFNGRLAKKGLQTDLTAAYWEKSTLDGFTFRVAPKGGNYKDELLAYFAKA
jgi:hypothetical protein